MHARVSAYRNRLVVELLITQSIIGEAKTSLDHPGAEGQTILNSKLHLGVSSEALAMLQKVVPGTEPVGDVFWKQSANGNSIFAWRGGPIAAFHPRLAKGASTFGVGDFFLVPNDPSDKARAVVEAEFIPAQSIIAV